jgi:two-component system phosphate regulon sensor histidine kinase PhoR
VLGAHWLVVSHARSVAPIVRAAREVAEGDFRTRIRTERADEIGDLARAVDAVADRRMAILRQAEEERGELRAILDNAAEGIVVLGPEGRIQLINAAARVIFDAPLDATGRPFVEVTRNSQIQRFLDHLREGPAVQQIDAQIGDEDPRTVRIAGGLVPGVKGNEGRVVLLATDVSDLRRLERMRVDFVANASHELKTPLASILGYAETLRDDSELDESTRRKFLDTILRNAARLEELITDMLRLARLDTDASTWNFAPVDAAALVERVVQEHVNEARTRGVRLKCQVSHAASPITADAELVRQLVSNLVGNAVKFTPSGGTVDVLVDGVGEGITIDVNDTGIGIAPDHLPRVFERFYRADAGRAREVGGTGLGLAIAKHAAAVHGGRIDVESTLGQGTRFRVFLPNAPPER